MIPIFAGSSFHSAAWLRTSRIAWKASFTASVVGSYPSTRSRLRSTIVEPPHFARRDDDRRARVRRLARRAVNLDRRVVNVQRGQEPIGVLRRGIVTLRLMDALVIEQRGVLRIKREHEPARQRWRGEERPIG